MLIIFFIQDLEIDMVQTREGLTSSRCADRQSHLVIEVSLDNRLVLYMQDQHRSDDI